MTTPTPVEAREVPVWTPTDGPIRTRTWTRGQPAVEVRVGGRWCPADLAQREDRRDGTVVYHVSILLPGATSRASRVYAWDPRSIRPVRAGTTDPSERTWT